MRYCISDIHGELQCLKSLLNKIDFSTQDTLFILGDMIDRGPDSAGVLDLIIEYKSKGYDIQCLKGNHEDMLLKSIDDWQEERIWRSNGAKETIESYKLGYDLPTNKFWELIPQDHKDLLENLPTFIKLKDYILVHAGLKFKPNRDDFLMQLSYGIKPREIKDPLKDTHDYDMMWLRDFIVDPKMMKKKILVTGHTPLPLFDSIWPLRDKSDESKHIMIDGGCCYTEHKDKGFGYLVALRLEDKELFWVQNERN